MATPRTPPADPSSTAYPLLGAPPSARGVILVGTDLSESADEAIRQGFGASVLRNQRLIVVHVAPDPVHINMLFPRDSVPGPDLIADRTVLLGELDERVTRLTGAPSGSFDVLVEEGVAEEVLVRLAEHLEAELMVVGASPHGLVARLFGTVAGRVVRHAHLPVLVARPTQNRGRVLVATDLSDPSLPAVETGVREAERRGAELHLVHCLGVPMPPAGMPFMPSAVGPVLETDHRAESDALHGADERLRRALDHFSAAGVCHVVEGSAGAQILALVETLRPELIVLGTIGNTGLKRLVLGSVAEYVVGNATVPTMVVRLHAA